VQIAAAWFECTLHDRGRGSASASSASSSASLLNRPALADARLRSPPRLLFNKYTGFCSLASRDELAAGFTETSGGILAEEM
jgi:hypothetical protein